MGMPCMMHAAVLIVLLLPLKLCLTVNNTRGLCIDGRATYGPGFISCFYRWNTIYNKTVVKVIGLPVYSLTHREEGGGRAPESISRLISTIRARRKFLDYIPGIARDTVKTAFGKKTVLKLKLGFEDPAYTGMAAGCMACILTYCGGTVQYTPDFSGKNFEVDLYIKGVIIPVVLVFIALKHGILYLKDRFLERDNVKGGRKYEFNG